MTIREARAILCEMQKWRRGEPPYDGDAPETHRTMPHTQGEFGKAIDTAIHCLGILDGVHEMLYMTNRGLYDDKSNFGIAKE